VDYIDIETRTFLAVPGHKEKDKYEFGTIISFAYKV
jgi:valyl-tRNA synthetase